MTKIRLNVVAVPPKAEQRLRERFMMWAEPYIIREDLGLSDASVRHELNRILQDHRVDPLEAPEFHKFVKKMAGDDNQLTPEEVDLAPLEQQQQQAIQEQTETAKKLQLGALALLLQPAGLMEKLDDAIALFQSTTEDGALQRDLDAAIDLVESHEKMVAETVQQLREEKIGFFGYLHFINAENMLGLSSWISEDGSPFTSVELEGATQLLDDLQEIHAGLILFRNQLQAGKLETDHYLVQRFLHSPYAAAINFRHYFGEENGLPTGDEDPNYLLYGGLIDRAYRYGAVHLAYHFADEVEATLGPRQNLMIRRNLPGGVSKILTEQMTSVANAFCSLDSLALMATGAGLGKFLLGGTTWGIRLMEAVLKKLGPHAIWLPGIFVFVPSTGQGWMISAAKFFGNFLFEAGKVSLFSGAGRLVADQEGGEVGSRAALLLGGINFSYAARAEELLANGLSRADLNPSVRILLERQPLPANGGRVSAERLARQLEHRSLRLTRAEGPEQRLVRVKDGLKRTGECLEKEETLRNKIGGWKEKIFAFHQEHPRFVSEATLRRAEQLSLDAGQRSGSVREIAIEMEALLNDLLARQKLVEKIGRAEQDIYRLLKGHANGSGAKITKEVGELVQRLEEKSVAELDAILKRVAELRKQLARAEQLRQANRPMQRVPSTGRGKGGKKVGRGGGEPAVASEASPEPVAPKPASKFPILEKHIIDPPKEFIADDVARITNDRVILFNGVSKEIAVIYKEFPQYRAAIWRKISELAEGDLIRHRARWKTLQAREAEFPLVRGRIANYRLIAERLPDGKYRIISFGLRKEVYGRGRSN